MVQRADGEEVDVDPDGAAPVRGVVLRVLLHVEGRVLGQRSEAVRSVEEVRISQGLENDTWDRGTLIMDTVEIYLYETPPSLSLSGERICSRKGNSDT